ncbi:MAG: TonB-dependent receptor [Gluconobacter cerinus]|uniref:TonB-dependent receptor n=1 Tax=Gluconobacter cerinus TaxID=38307 RepID=UPI0039E7BDE6
MAALRTLAFACAGLSVFSGFGAEASSNNAPSSTSSSKEDRYKKTETVTSHGKAEHIRVHADAHSYGATSSSIADKLPTTFLQQTQTTNVVTHQVIEDMTPQTMEDVAKYVPGISIGNNFGGTQDDLMKRGFGAVDDGSILRNGVRMPTGRNFDLATTERVEVLKGPASLFYGMQEPGGVINVITKQPRKTWGANLGTTWSSLGGGYGDFDVGGPLTHGLSFRLVGSYKNENYWRNFGSNRQKLLSPSLRFEHGRFTADVSYEWAKYNNTLDRGAVFSNGRAVSGPEKRLDESWAKSFGERHLLATTMEYRLTEHNRIRLSGGWNRDNYHDRQADPSAYNAVTGILTRRYRSNTGTIRANGYASLDYISNHVLWGMKHDLVVGADYENRQQNQGAFIDGTRQGGFYPADPVYGLLKPVGPINNSNSDWRQHINSASGYIKDNIHLGHGLILAPGVRYQFFHITYGGRRPYVQTTDASYTKPLPFVALVYQLGKRVSFYGDYSQSFTPNQLDAGSVLEGGYKPTMGRQFEVGARYQDRFLTADVALYNIHKKNVQQSAGLDETGNTLQRLAGLVGSKGVEASVAGKLDKHWNILANYAFTYARILRDTPADEGKLVANVAKHTGGGYLTYETALPWLQTTMRIGAGARYVGRRAGDLNNTFWLPGYTTVDAFASWHTGRLLGHDTSLQVNAVNLANKAYFVSTAGTPLRVSWGQGRTVHVGIEVGF